MTCSHWPRNGQKCEAEATRLLYAPDGTPVPGGLYCQAHADAITGEYRQKLAEDWPSVEVDEHGHPIPERPATTGGVLYAGRRV